MASLSYQGDISQKRSYETQIDIYRRHFDGHGLGTAGKHDGPGRRAMLFSSNEDIYLKIYNLDKDGVERREVWEGHLPEGATKAYNAPYGQVGYATKINPEDPWEENQEECYGGAEIDIP
jgi:hypothetical protein